MQRTPHASGGKSIWSITTGSRSAPSMRGIEKPYTSASMTPTEWPRCASATARFVVTDDFPTPPLPDEMRRQRVRDSGSANGIALPCAWPCACCVPAVAPGSPWSRSRSSARSSSFIAVKSRLTEDTPSRGRTAPSTRFVISLRSGQPGIVSAMRMPTLPASIETLRTMPRSTIERCSSGSSTGRKASRTCS